MTVALDTSLAVPLVVRSHEHHERARKAVSGDVVLTAQSLAETYSVLTRLPGDARLSPPDAARLIASNFGDALVPPARLLRRLPSVLSEAGIAGGQVYDALVALAARESRARLLSADARAGFTYAVLGVDFELVALA